MMPAYPQRPASHVTGDRAVQLLLSACDPEWVDLVGSSDGFRRPGYILSAEPALSWTRGSNTFRFSLPIAVERNRERSVADLRNDHHGDASFPDYLVPASFSHRF